MLLTRPLSTSGSDDPPDPRHESIQDLLPKARIELMERVRGEYREMPALALTVDQARRLWGLDPQTSESLLKALVETAAQHALSSVRTGPHPHALEDRRLAAQHALSSVRTGPHPHAPEDRRLAAQRARRRVRPQALSPH